MISSPLVWIEDDELIRTCSGVELRAEIGELALQRVRVARAGALGEHARRERRQAGLIAFEARAAVDDERDVNQRQRVVLDHLNIDAVREHAALDPREIELRSGAGGGRFGAIEGALSLSVELER